jgi:transposase
MRTRFGKVASGLIASPRSKRQLRNRANADLQREGKILDEVLTRAASSGVVVIAQIKPAIEAKLGKTLALSSVYRMLARQGWRNLAPDTQHPQGNPQARGDWKKNSPARWAKS